MPKPRPLASARAHWPGRLPETRAACGMGFVATPGAPASHRVLELGVEALARLGHRGGMDSDGRSGDGAGVLTQIPHRLLGARPGRLAVGVLFEWDPRGRVILAEALHAAGTPMSEWRPVPVDPAALGDKAAAEAPRIVQALIEAPTGMPAAEWETALYRARRAAERRASDEGVRMYVASLSSRTVVYKGLLAGQFLSQFYPDLREPLYETQLAVFHQRYSTNTRPDWRNAQPFRMLAHNGEINTISGNRSWMRARGPHLPEDFRDPIWVEGSDSASLDNALELLIRLGSDAGEALMALVPDAWEGRGDLAPQVRDFYRFWSTRYEPWDGPAALAFSDGVVAGAALDRNGLRPLRYQVTHDGLVVAASEAGVVSLEPARVRERGRLGPGQLLLVDCSDGSVLHDAEAKERIAARQDYGDHADHLLHPVERHRVPTDVPENLAALQRAHGWGAEDVKMTVKTMAETGSELVYSMGDDTPIAPLGRTGRRLYGHLRQRFAQVTNPPIDSLRERFVMSLRVVLGPRDAFYGAPRLPATGSRFSGAHRDEPPRLLELDSPVLGAGELARILEEESALVLDATFDRREALALALDRLGRAAVRAPAGILILSDRTAASDRLPVPSVLAVGAVHERLLAAGERFRKDLIVLSGDCADVHDAAMLIAAGAAAVYPYLGIATARQAVVDVKHGEEPGNPDAAERAYRRALEAGLLKVMAKMGISCVASYCGAGLFEALGLGADVMRTCFPEVPSRLGGASLADLEASVRENHGGAFQAAEPVPDRGLVRFRKAGEWHAHNPLAVRQAQKAAETADREAWETYKRLADMGAAAAVRDLLDFQPAAPVPLAEVEPASAILPRFVATAMSLGALSPEAHLALAQAMNSIGARSNSGEGGEDPALYGAADALRGDNKVKQVASARFGVTPRYLLMAEELEVKMAQGAKPGEGGQLPGAKVTSLIARLRHAQPGMQLISPPPHHDIYSIEDLAQLIHDLKAINPRARVGVKLVAEAGVGTIAAGVAKARADYVLISGHDGGTGAAALTSIKAAGIPWEMGLAETQQALVANRLRERLAVRTDGGLRTGADIVKAALLGAEEFGLGTMLLVALGCDMARQCHLNTCPTGIATQRDDLRAKFAGRPEHVVNYLTLVAEEVREILARLGARSLDQVIGRTELLRAVPGSSLDLDWLLQPPGEGPRRRVWKRNGEPPAADPPSGPIDNARRAVGAQLSRRAIEAGETASRSYTGPAGQSFAAWLAAGVELELEGEANDYVGKGMAGGVAVIRPYAMDGSVTTPVLAGNTALYGATGGRLFIAGRAGERFGVRNSGAVAVVEGAGDHFGEYMTGGTIVSLGPVGSNLGAGMTGGAAYVREWAGLNQESVAVRPVPAEDAPELRALVEEHARRTASPTAAAILDDWERCLGSFRQVVPLARLEAERAAAADPARVTA